MSMSSLPGPSITSWKTSQGPAKSIKSNPSEMTKATRTFCFESALQTAPVSKQTAARIQVSGFIASLRESVGGCTIDAGADVLKDLNHTKTDASALEAN